MAGVVSTWAACHSRIAAPPHTLIPSLLHFHRRLVPPLLPTHSSLASLMTWKTAVMGEPPLLHCKLLFRCFGAR